MLSKVQGKYDMSVEAMNERWKIINKREEETALKCAYKDFKHFKGCQKTDLYCQFRTMQEHGLEKLFKEFTDKAFKTGRQKQIMFEWFENGFKSLRHDIVNMYLNEWYSKSRKNFKEKLSVVLNDFLLEGFNDAMELYDIVNFLKYIIEVKENELKENRLSDETNNPTLN